MAVPKRRKSKSKVRTKRSHHALTKPNLVRCKSCKEFILPHRICPECGFYNGKVEIKAIVKTARDAS